MLEYYLIYLRTDLIYESYVPKKEDRDKRSLVRHRITLSRTKTKLVNKVHSILDKYDYQTDLTDIFSKSGIEWLKSLTPPLVTPVDRIILDSSIASIEAINQQIDTQYQKRYQSMHHWIIRTLRFFSV